MRTILFILQKEFIQIFRDKTMLPIIFVAPLMQLLVLSYTATFEIKNVSLAFVDYDAGSYSQELKAKFKGSPFFTVKGDNASLKHWDKPMENNDIEMIVVIPRGFEKELTNKNKTSVQIITDAVNGSAANLMAFYAGKIIRDFNENITAKTLGKSKAGALITLEPRYRFNSELDYKTNMVPGILVLLITLIGAFLSGMNVVREKEIGSIEQINVTPIKKHQFIFGKLFPFWIIAMVDLVIGLILAKTVFSIPIVGSVWLILGAASVYMVLVLGIGLFISTIVDTQQQAMFIAWFIFVIFIMLSGLFTPLDGMPRWAAILNIFNPIAYFIEFMRLVMLKGAGLYDVKEILIKISVYAFAMLSFAIMRYHKRA